MSVIAEVAINVDGRNAVSQINGVNAAANNLNGTTSRLQSAFGGLNQALAALGLSALTQQLASAGLDASRTDTRIRNLADANGETARVFDIAARAANAFGLSNLEAEKGIADLYGRLRPTGIALSDIETVFNGVNKAALTAGLGAADTEGVFLQLSQALGSGALQGDELRSIMERMPAVGQAVAKVMGVTVGEVKKLGSDGKITTAVMIKAAAELNKLKPPPPDPFKVFGAQMQNLRVEIGENILPIITPFVNGLLQVVRAFSNLPEPVQSVIAVFLLVATAVTTVGVALATLAPVFTALGTAWAGVVALNIGGLIAGWLPAVVGAVGGITAALGGMLAFVTGTLIPGLIAVFSGPVGWTVLAVAAVVAMVAYFREPILEFLTWLGTNFDQILGQLVDVAYSIFVQPFIDLWDNVLKGPVTAYFEFLRGIFEWGMQAVFAILYQILVRPFNYLWETVLREPVTSMLLWLERAWDGVGRAFQSYVVIPIQTAWSRATGFLVSAAQGIGTVISGVWQSIAQTFTNYIVTPIQTLWTNLVNFMQSAMTSVANSVKNVWESLIGSIKAVIRGVLQSLAGMLNSVSGEVNKLIAAFNQLPGPDIGFVPTISVPAFAEGGVVTRPTLAMVGDGGEPEYIIPQSKMAAAASNFLAGDRGSSIMDGGGGSMPTINITTGPVMQIDGKNYVSLEDMQRAMRETASSVLRTLRTPSARYGIGVA